MNRLWLRLGLMISAVLLLVFILQFIEIKLTSGGPGAPFHVPSNSEIQHRLYRFMGFSLLMGLAGGFAIGRFISTPVASLARAAREVGSGKLHVRVPVRGSREMRDLAETFNRMASALQQGETARNNLMADVSHELRTPLTVLEANLRAALDGVLTLDEAGVASLYAQTRHLIRLVNDLRELSLAETGQLNLERTPTDVQTLVNETMQALEPLASEKKIQMTTEIGDLPPANVDPVRIRQVLFNLLSNALRHTSAGGMIRVSCKHKQPGLTLTVEDSGEGLGPEELASLFNRFYRVDKSRNRETGGSGLGLSIAKAIVEAHGGSIVAYSAGKDHGTCFTIALPAEA
jgi:signal transduction histidine kinase